MVSEKIDLTEFLSQQYLCESLTVNEVTTLIEYTEMVTFEKGDVIADIVPVAEGVLAL